VVLSLIKLEVGGNNKHAIVCSRETHGREGSKEDCVRFLIKNNQRTDIKKKKKFVCDPSQEKILALYN
jgi:hypothetical protein